MNIINTICSIASFYNVSLEVIEEESNDREFMENYDNDDNNYKVLKSKDDLNAINM